MFDHFAKNTLVPLVLRVGLAVIFIYHGLEKVQVEGGTGWADRMPDPPHDLVQMAVAWGELLGGIALLLGILTRLAALGIAAIMVGAIITVHVQHGFSAPQGQGYEYNFTILVICAGVILLGPGNLALDRFFRFRRKESRPHG